MINETFTGPFTVVPLVTVISCSLVIFFGWIRLSAITGIGLALSVMCLYFGLHRPIWLLCGVIFLIGLLINGVLNFLDVSLDWWRRKHPKDVDLEGPSQASDKPARDHATLIIAILVSCIGLIIPFGQQAHAFDPHDTWLDASSDAQYDEHINRSVRVDVALYVIDIADRAGKMAIRESLQDAQIPGELLQSPSSALEWLRAYGEPVSAFEDTAELLNERYGHISHIRTVQYPQITYVTGSDGSPTDSIRELKFKPIRTGLSIDLEPSISDTGFSLLLDFSFSWLDGKVPNSVQDLDGPEPSLYEIKHRSTLEFADGESLVLFLDSVHPGRSVVLLLTGHLKRPAGDPAGPDGRLAQTVADLLKLKQAIQE